MTLRFGSISVKQRYASVFQSSVSVVITIIIVVMILVSLLAVGLKMAPYATVVLIFWLGFWLIVVHSIMSRYGEVHSRTAMVSKTDDRETTNDIAPRLQGA